VVERIDQMGQMQPLEPSQQSVSAELLALAEQAAAYPSSDQKITPGQLISHRAQLEETLPGWDQIKDRIGANGALHPRPEEYALLMAQLASERGSGEPPTGLKA
jgi:hypothetical protein